VRATRVEALFASGHVADLILVLLGLEAVAVLLLAGRRAATGRIGSHLSELAAAAGIVLAFRAALTGAAWPVMAVFLLLAFLAHAISVVASWRELWPDSSAVKGPRRETPRLASGPHGAPPQHRH
jgi:hypothetical protein